MTEFAPRKGLGPTQIADLVERILAEATLEEKVGMMSGRGFFKAYAEDLKRWGARPYRAGGGIERLGVPALWFTDGPRGVARGNSTCFPCSMARGASFDIDLERRVGEVMGIEARAQGCNLSGAVCINLLRHPSWGRAQETYGEDPVLLGEMGSALAAGIQAHNVIATAKHFALNSMENARFKVDVEVDERSLHEVYLPHFRMMVERGVMSVMSAYNKVNGEYCGQDRVLLTDILRTEWGFEGFVHSDWIEGLHAIYGVTAGLDIENPEPLIWGDRLVEAVRAGQVEQQVIDRACRRILGALYRIACADDPLPDYPMSLVASDAHRALAREVAESSAVLLENDGTLPLAAAAVSRLAVLGRLAAIENTGDHGSSRVRPPYVVTALQGLSDYLGADRILHADEDNLEAARAAAEAADAVVVVVGTTAYEEGEFIDGDINLGQGEGIAIDAAKLPEDIRNRARGGDRTDLNLPAGQRRLIAVAAASGRPVIVVLVSGSAILVEDWRDEASAIVQTFYSGMEGGTALARLLFGAVSPSGRLPFTLARDPAHYPFFDKDADRIVYDLWHGYPLFLRDGNAPRYPFGHGLTYGRVEKRSVRAFASGDSVRIAASVANVSDRDVAHVLQIYAEAPAEAAEHWPRKLVAFTRLQVHAGTAATCELVVPLRHLCRRMDGRWHLVPGEYRFLLADNAADPEPKVARIHLPPPAGRA
jgi:beta-glucosidase